MRLACLLGSLSFISFIAVDHMLIEEGEKLRNALMVRAGLILSLGLLAATTWSERLFPRFATPLTLVAVWVIGMGVNVLTWLTGGGESEYHTALIICFFAFALFPLPWRQATAWLTFVLLGLSYDILMIATGTTGPLGTWATHNAMVWASVFIAGAMFHFAMNLRRDDHANRERLATANERLQALDKAKSRFFANVSHELRTPLTLALAPVQALLEDTTHTLSGSQRDQLQLIERNALRLLKLVDDLLELSKAEAASVKLRPRTMNLREHAADLVAQVAPLARRKQLTLVLEDGPEVPELGADPDQLERILLNLLSNAIKFTPDGGTITTRVFEKEGRQYVEVEDTGPGIPPDEIARVFRRFHQVDSSSTRSHGGTGIGLALVRELVELHDGKTFARTNPEVGATVGFWLPEGGVVVEETYTGEKPAGDEGLPEWHDALRRQEGYRLRQIQDATERRLAPRFPAGSRSHTVMIVEDNVDMIRFVSTLLSAEHHIITATDGLSGLRLARDRRPDLIVSDVMMPGLNGFELVKALREDPATRAIPVVLLTARGDARDRLAGREGGADAYLTKPFHANELTAAVRSLLTSRGALLEGAEARRVESVQYLAGGIVEALAAPIELIEHALDQDDEAREALASLRAAVADLETMSRAGTGARSKVAFDELVREVLPIEAEKGIRLEQELRATRSVEVSRSEVSSVLTELVANAVRATRENGRITIRTWDEPEQGVSLSITDQGPGLSPDAAERIFQPFYSTEPTRRGMGLPVARRVAEAHGGNLTLAPGGPGATFVLQLPEAPP